MNNERVAGMLGAEGEAYQFKWDQQGSRVLEQLRALYGEHDGVVGDALGIQPDVVLFSSDGACEEAHRMVLSLCSGYFQDLFVKISQSQVKRHRCRDNPAVVVLGNVQAYQLKQLLQFIYTGEVTVPLDQMEAFLELGKAFKIEGIRNSESSKNATSINSPPQQKPSSSRPILRSAQKNDDNFAIAVKSTSVNVTPALSADETSTQSCLDEDVDISYDSYPVKIEAESGELGEGVSGDPLADEMDEGSHSSDDEDDTQTQERNDPTYQDNPHASKRPRRDTVINARIARAAAQMRSILNTSQKKSEWVEQEPLSKEDLKLQWHIKSYNTAMTTTFYTCAPGGRKCPARLKKKVMKDGTVIFLNNNVPHDPHPKQVRPRGLTPEQKQFVLQCLEGGVTGPAAISKSFEAQGLESPGIKKIKGLLSYVRDKRDFYKDSAGGDQPEHQFSLEDIL